MALAAGYLRSLNKDVLFVVGSTAFCRLLASGLSRDTFWTVWHSHTTSLGCVSGVGAPCLVLVWITDTGQPVPCRHKDWSLLAKASPQSGDEDGTLSGVPLLPHEL